jgi:AraC-like DNA-binding protein
MVENGFDNKMVPDALSDIWILSGDPLLLSFDNRAFSSKSGIVIWGLFDKASFIKSSGITKVFSIKIHPFAFNLFFNYPLKDLTNRCENCTLILNKYEIRFLNNIASIDLIESRIRLIESRFLQLLSQKKENPFLSKAYYAVYENYGRIQVVELASELGISRQYLSKLFKHNIGFTIKQFEAMLRIRSCIDYKINNETPSLSQLAHHFEYFDQAHFIHQFKQMIGESPKSFFGKKIHIKQHLNLLTAS